MRAKLKTLNGIEQINAYKDFYNMMSSYLEQPICPKCHNLTPTVSIVKPGINGAKCHNCFIHGTFVNIVRRKDLIKKINNNSKEC